MTYEEQKHRERMLAFAKKKEAENRPLTPQELAKAIQDLKKRFPNDFPKSR